MTVSSETIRILYDGDGETIVFPYTWKIYATTDLKVVYRNANGAETILTLNTHYTVSGAGNDNGGNVTLIGVYAANPPAEGTNILVILDLPFTQLYDYVENDPFPAESHEELADRVVKLCQILNEQLARAIKLPVTSSETDPEITEEVLATIEILNDLFDFSLLEDTIMWDDNNKVFKELVDEEYVTLDPDHGELSGLSDDDHPQYLKLDKASQTLSEDLSVSAGKTIDGRDISVDGAALDVLETQVAAGFTKFLASPTNKITWTAATDWTDVDISSDTGSDTAKAAILAVELYFTAGPNSHVRMRGLFRKNGSSETAILPRIVNWQYDQSPTYTIAHGNACIILVELDGSEIFETKLQTDAGSPGAISYKVDLIGYFI